MPTPEELQQQQKRLEEMKKWNDHTFAELMESRLDYKRSFWKRAGEVDEAAEDKTQANAIVSAELKKEFQSGFYVYEDPNDKKKSKFGINYDKDTKSVTVVPSKPFHEAIAAQMDFLMATGVDKFVLNYQMPPNVSDYAGGVFAIRRFKEELMQTIDEAAKRGMTLELDDSMKAAVQHYYQAESKTIFDMIKAMKVNAEVSMLYTGLNNKDLAQAQFTELADHEPERQKTDAEVTTEYEAKATPEEKLDVLTKELDALNERYDAADSIVEETAELFEIQDYLAENTEKLVDAANVRNTVAKESGLGWLKNRVNEKEGEFQSRDKFVEEIVKHRENNRAGRDNVLNEAGKEFTDLDRRRILWQGKLDTLKTNVNSLADADPKKATLQTKITEQEKKLTGLEKGIEASKTTTNNTKLQNSPAKDEVLKEKAREIRIENSGPAKKA